MNRTVQRNNKDSKQQNRIQAQLCPECSSTVVYDSKHGETVCEECGTIVTEDVLDRGPEWRSFDAAERTRVGTPTTPTKHDKGLSTTISWTDRDANGQLLSQRKRNQMQRLRTRHRRSLTSDPTDEHLKQAFSEIDRMASALGLPQSVRETSCVIYRRAHSASLLPGRSIEAVAGAALYIAARMESIPRTFDEMETVARIDRTPIARAKQAIENELGLAVAPVDPQSYFPRFGSKLDIPMQTLRKARDILDCCDDTYLGSGKSPVGLAAAALYVASKMTGGPSLSQNEISDVANTTKVTIQEHYPVLMDYYANHV